MKICQEVLALQPISLPQATTLAKLQEDKLHDHYRSHKVTPPYNHHQPISLAPPPSPNSRQSFVHRTLEEMVLRREKGLCYNCDEKWSSSIREHKQGCANIPLLLQGHSFIVALHVLATSGADVVLGVDWLKTLGLMVTD